METNKTEVQKWDNLKQLNLLFSENKISELGKEIRKIKTQLDNFLRDNKDKLNEQTSVKESDDTLIQQSSLKPKMELVENEDIKLVKTKRISEHKENEKEKFDKNFDRQKSNSYQNNNRDRNSDKGNFGNRQNNNWDKNKLNNKPIIAPKANNPNVIKKFCFKFLLFFSNTKIPIPAPLQRPPKHAEKEIMPDVYSSTSTTLPAQFGIKPINAHITGKYHVVGLIAFIKISSPPAKYIIKEMATFAINIYANISVVCFKPCSTICQNTLPLF